MLVMHSLSKQSRRLHQVLGARYSAGIGKFSEALEIDVICKKLVVLTVGTLRRVHWAVCDWPAIISQGCPSQFVLDGLGTLRLLRVSRAGRQSILH